MGVSGMVTWPNVNSVSHLQPSGDLKIFFENSETTAQITLIDRYGVETVYSSQNGSVTVPHSDLNNAIERRISLELTIDGNVYSTLLLLPEVETESFDIPGVITANGGYHESSSYVSTDYIDVYDVAELVYSGVTYGDAIPIAAYDENKVFEKILFEHGEWHNKHTVFDGTYRYIRACGHSGYNPQLKLYFRTRG